MKSHIIVAGAVFASAAAALTEPASAQSTVSYTPGDLLLGFNQNGNSTDYLLDLGPASQFLNASAPFQVPGLGNFAADLSSNSVFGSNWAANTGSNLVQWGVAGATDTTAVTQFNLPPDTLFFTQGRINPGTRSTALLRNPDAAQAAINSLIDQVGEGSPGYSGSTSTANSTVGIIQTNATDPNSNSWLSQSPGSQAFSEPYSIEQAATGSFNGPTNSVLDLWELTPSTGASRPPGVLVGSFSLAPTGALTFSPAPEPAAITSVLSTALLLGMTRLRPRRTSK